MHYNKENKSIIKYAIAFIKGHSTLVIGMQIVLLLCFTTSCDDFVDVDLPKDQLSSEVIFENAVTAADALQSIYSGIYGLTNRINRNLGLYADELDFYGTQSNFYDHTIFELDNTVKDYWSKSYNHIYAANAVVEGVQNSTTLSLADHNQLKGEALFIRAYLHSLLVDLWGPIPYIATTDYIVNTTVSRMPVDVVYNHIISDLTLASSLLGEDISGEKIRPNKAVADALLARLYLITNNWELAKTTASKAIVSFTLEPDLNQVFLKNASGSIWQFKPFSEGQNTLEGQTFVLDTQPNDVALSEVFVEEAFEPLDQRAVNWVGTFTNSNGTWYYPNKYKEGYDTDATLEYSVVFRLAEQYLIRAEALTEQGKISEAQSDLNDIRNRAGLPNTTAATQDDLLTAILNERRVELFAERSGHRWFDLKRWFHLERPGNAADVLAPLKPSWQVTNLLLPVPESEILLNPNLLPQNDGYN